MGGVSPIIRSLKLHCQPLVFHTWQVVGRCQVQCAWQCPTTCHVWKTRGWQCSFRLLMMGGVSPKICWASYKYGIIKCWYIVASCWIFFMRYTMMHWSSNVNYKYPSAAPVSAICSVFRHSIQYANQQIYSHKPLINIIILNYIRLQPIKLVTIRDVQTSATPKCFPF